VQPLAERQQEPQAERQQLRLERLAERLVVQPAMQPVDVLLVQPLLEAQPPGVLIEQLQGPPEQALHPYLPSAPWRFP
jgi:hypothetical protein